MMLVHWILAHDLIEKRGNQFKSFFKEEFCNDFDFMSNMFFKKYEINPVRYNLISEVSNNVN